MSSSNVIDIVGLTETAIKKLAEIAQAEQFDPAERGIRLSIVGGGCSGLSYKIGFDDIKDTDKFVKDTDEFKVIVDPKSAIYLKGVTLDYSDGLDGKGFIFVNPNAKNTCGCGESFSV